MSIKKVLNIFIYIFAIIGFVLTAGYIAIKTGLINEKGIIDNQRLSFLSDSTEWKQGSEWNTLKQAIINDKDIINKVAKDADISPRLIISMLIPEQLRLFHSEREIFKKIFAPLQILGNQNQFSWGIMGIKQETAKAIENHLKDNMSIYFLGQKYENLLDFKTKNIDQERFERLTDEKNHYYSYMYTALYLKQIINQWTVAGFDISNRPEILATLYNIGFNNSHPNANPQSGGAEIDIRNKIYSFGSLAFDFYYSDELLEFNR